MTHGVFTLPDLATVLGIGPEGLRLLRHLTHPKSAVLRPSAVIDGRGTVMLNTGECLRAAVALALCRQGLNVPAIRAALDLADATTFTIFHAFQAIRDGQPCQFRILTHADGRRESSYAATGQELSPVGEAYVIVALDVVWQPFLSRMQQGH